MVPTKSEPTGSAVSTTTPPAKEKWWVEHAVKIVVAIIGLLSLTGVASLARAYFTD